MPSKARKQRNTPVTDSSKLAKRTSKGTWAKGFSGASGLDVGRARRDLNGATIGALREAFDRYGKAAIVKVAKQQPAIFLKMLVLLVPRELELTRSSGPKGMTDEQLEASVQAIERYLAARGRRPGDDAKPVIDASPLLPEPAPPTDPSS